MKKGIPAPKEQQLQIASAELFDLALHKDWRAWHTPNGEQRNAIVGAKLKRMGVKPGVPDWVLASPAGKLHFIELKRHGERLSPSQEAFSQWCHKFVIPYFIATDLDTVIAAAQWWGALDPKIKV